MCMLKYSFGYSVINALGRDIQSHKEVKMNRKTQWMSGWNTGLSLRSKVAIGYYLHSVRDENGMKSCKSW